MNDHRLEQSVSGNATHESTARQFLTFRLAGEVYAIPILCVREIHGWEPVTRPPGSVAYLLGVMNLRGAIVPVVDLRTRLGLEPGTRTPTSVVIVARIDTIVSGAVTLGFLVDAVSDVVNVAADDERPAPSVCGTADRNFLAGVATVDDKLVILLDLVRLVEASIPRVSDGVAA